MISIQNIYRKGLHQIFRFTPEGDSILSFDWDLLIVLDACRLDLFKEVAPEYEFIGNVGSITSIDTMTPIWMKKTFTDDAQHLTSNMYYICANPASDKQLESSQFEELDEIWRYEWDDQIGNVRAESVTRRAITVGREKQPERLLVHYNQPHWPFVPAMETSSGEGIQLTDFGEYQDHRVWERLRRGEVSKEEVWRGYKENLRYVLDSVEVLLDNIDADRVVITSDHGNALGEWGIYGHPMHMPIPCIQQVPWVETTAEDSGAERNHLEKSVDNDSRDVEEKLRQLGYY